MTPLIIFWLFVVADAAVQTPPTFRQTLHCCSELPFHDFAPAIVSLLTLIAAFISRRHSLSIGELQNSEFSWHRVFCQYVRKVDKHRARTATLRRQLLACWQNWATHVAAPNWPVLAARVGSPRPWFKQYEMMLVIGEMSHDDGTDATWITADDVDGMSQHLMPVWLLQLYQCRSDGRQGASLSGRSVVTYCKQVYHGVWRGGASAFRRLRSDGKDFNVRDINYY